MFSTNVYATETVSTSSPKEGDIEINETNFPDANFRQYITDEFDTDKDDFLLQDEITSATTIYVSDLDINSLKGIEYFTNLTELFCNNNKLISLDTSNNLNLEKLDCSYTQLTSLNVGKNLALTSLGCDDNSLTSLDLSKNTALIELNCDFNQLTSLDLSENTSLEKLDCSSNQLTNLDLSKNIELKKLYIIVNPLGELNLTKNIKLDELRCMFTKLTSLDISKNTALKELDCRNPQIPPNEPSCEFYKSYENKIKSLDVSKNTVLDELKCSGNQLTSLDLSNNLNLTDIDCGNQNPSIPFEKSKGYNLSAYDTNFDKSKVSGIDFKDDGSIVGVELDTSLSYSYDIGFAEPLSLRSDGMTMDVTLTFVTATDASRLEEAKPLVEKAITDLAVTNETTDKNILDAVTTAITDVNDITASWKTGSPTITKATSDKEGSITGIIILTNGSDTVEISVHKTIYKLIQQVIKSIGETDKVKVSGMISEYGKLYVELIEVKDGYDDILKKIDTVKNAIIGSFEARIVGGTYEGKLIVSFNIGSKYDGKTITIYHQKEDKTIETLTTVCKNGEAVITVDELSPFVLTINKSDVPQTSDSSAMMTYIGLATLTCVVGYVLKKKKEVNE